MDKGLLSVIVPVYKAERYLAKCVGSILAQTYGNLELILVDDGSPDRSGGMCDRFAESDPRVKVVHKPNGGVSSARNAGLEVARGKFIGFVDSDDYIDPQMYEKLAAALPDDSSIAFCDLMEDFGDSMREAKTVDVFPDRLDTLKSLIMSGIGTGCANMMIGRSLMEELRFPEHTSRGEDYWVSLRLFISARNIGKVDEPLYYYVKSNAESLTHSASYESLMDEAGSLEENRRFLESSGLYESLRREWNWSVLRYKSAFVMSPKLFGNYRNLFPEANAYVGDCPLLSSRIKLLMKMLDRHLDFMVRLVLQVYGKSN